MRESNSASESILARASALEEPNRRSEIREVMAIRTALIEQRQLLLMEMFELLEEQQKLIERSFTLIDRSFTLLEEQTESRYFYSN